MQSPSWQTREPSCGQHSAALPQMSPACLASLDVQKTVSPVPVPPAPEPPADETRSKLMALRKSLTWAVKVQVAASKVTFGEVMSKIMSHRSVSLLYIHSPMS